ncbi:MAG: HisA/HisF-related TIM barrel protein, partial [Planctomycetota bacterium]
MSARFPIDQPARIFPAIDLRGGRCVRLIQGQRNEEIHYDDDPVAVARRWRDEGATCLHVIDLGAAFGEDSSSTVVLEICREIDLPVQTGGGIRDEAKVEELLSGGVARVILGTRAFKDPDFLARMIDTHGPERVIVGLDCDGDRVKVAGWEEAS